MTSTKALDERVAPIECARAVSREWVPVSDQYSDDCVSCGPGPLNTGDQFLKYRIVGPIGTGGYARVYQAFDTFLKRDIALKIVCKPNGNPKELKQRTAAEARFLVSVKHPYLVDVYDAGCDDDGVLFIAMELLRGESLRSLIENQGRLPWEQFVPIAVMIAEGMAIVHEHRAIHRDLKPDNIFVLENGTPRILDFGIAKFVDAPLAVTQKNTFHGTPSYMAPEQMLGRPATPHSDMYSLGVVFWEALAGKNPFRLEPCSTTEELAWRHLHFHPPLVSDYTQTVPRRIAKIINKMMAKPPAQRPQSMLELATNLRDCYATCLSASPTVASTRSTGTVVPPSGALIDSVCADEQSRALPLTRTQAKAARAAIGAFSRPLVTSWAYVFVLVLLAGGASLGLFWGGFRTSQYLVRRSETSGGSSSAVKLAAVSSMERPKALPPPGVTSTSLPSASVPEAVGSSAPPASPRRTTTHPRGSDTVVTPPRAKRKSPKTIDTETPLIGD